MHPEVQINFIAIVILIGVFLGVFISYFMIKKSFQNNIPNLFMGLFILSVSLVMLEGWMNLRDISFSIYGYQIFQNH